MPDRPQAEAADAPSRGRLDRLPPQSFFLVSAIFHYLGPSLAVLLFARIDVLGVAWLRIASAAVVLALWRRPWRFIGRLGTGERWNLLALGLVLAVMNSAFYLAVDRLPLSTVGAIEFLGTVILAAAGVRTRRNTGALVLTTAGVVTITSIRITGQPLGFVFAFANCALFMLYIVLGHRMANAGGRGAAQAGRPASIDRLAGAMVIAAVIATPWGLGGALPAFGHPIWLLAGAGVGVCSSVIPYVTRSAGHGSVAPRHVLADAGPAAGVRHHHRRDRAAPGPYRSGRRWYHAGSSGRRDPSTGEEAAWNTYGWDRPD